MSSRRTYGQYCGLARALDLVGERWTLLIVRDLAVSSRRFTDLLEGLPGMGTSLLSERLRHLEEHGAVRRRAADRPATGVLYELTERGEELARALAPLASWGASFLGDRSDEEYRPEWLAFMFRSAFRPHEAAGVHDCYEFRVEGSTLWVVIDDDSITVTQERPRAPDFVATLDIPTLADLGAGRVSAEEAVAAGRARFEGDPRAGWRALQLLGPPGLRPPEPVAARGRRRR